MSDAAADRSKQTLCHEHQVHLKDCFVLHHPEAFDDGERVKFTPEEESELTAMVHLELQERNANDHDPA